MDSRPIQNYSAAINLHFIFGFLAENLQNMTLKTTSFTGTTQLLQLLIEHKIDGIRKNILIPDDLLFELENFAKRNAIPHSQGRICCKCLKAHALKKAKEMNFSQKSINFLEDIFICQQGHDGYYIDKGYLIEI